MGESRHFNILRGVKQGDVLSAILFNCVLDMAFDSWRRKLSFHGLYVAHGIPRLSNTRYADDILLYAKSLDELREMAESLIFELRQVGLKLNASKTKILHTNIEDEDCDLDFCQIDDEFVRVLKPDEKHRYLGRQLSCSASQRADIEFRYREAQFYIAFQKHKSLLNDISTT